MGELISCARYSSGCATRAYNGTLQPRTRQNPRQAKATDNSNADKPTAEDAKTARKRRYML